MKKIKEFYRMYIYHGFYVFLEKKIIILKMNK